MFPCAMPWRHLRIGDGPERRGGTVLQLGVGLLERATDFPDDGPILVITDGECYQVRREHTFSCLPALARRSCRKVPYSRVS